MNSSEGGGVGGGVVGGADGVAGVVEVGGGVVVVGEVVGGVVGPMVGVTVGGVEVGDEEVGGGDSVTGGLATALPSGEATPVITKATVAAPSAAVITVRRVDTTCSWSVPGLCARV
jgi:hypothetical protein